jgi:hypothetical protein
MSRSGPVSGVLVLRLRVDQKKWSVFKTDKQKQIKNEMILTIFYLQWRIQGGWGASAKAYVNICA